MVNGIQDRQNQLLETVRRRPGMFVGDTRDGSGLLHMLWEVVGNAIDQHLLGEATRVEIELEGATASVRDDGLGLPVDEERDGLNVGVGYMTLIHGTPTADGHFPHVHIGHESHGVGLAPINCLCSKFVVDVRRGGRAYQVQFERGRLLADVQHLGDADERGTTVRFTADPEVFGESSFNLPKVRERLSELAYFNPALELRFQGARLDGGGLGKWCDRKLGPRASRVTHDPIHLMGYHKQVAVDVAFGWRRDGDSQLQTFACQARTLDGGSHERGFWEGLRQALPLVGYTGSIAGIPTKQFRSSLSRGLVAVVHAGLFAPEYDAPTKSLLRTKEARIAVRHVVASGFAVYLAQHPQLAKYLVCLARGDV